jgi:excisionase family DNA binding protein
MTETMTAPVLSVEQVAEMFACTEDTVRERAARGDLPGVKLGRDWRFPAAALYEAVGRLAIEEAAKRRAPTAVAVKARPRKAPPTLPSQ